MPGPFGSRARTGGERAYLRISVVRLLGRLGLRRAGNSAFDLTGDSRRADDDGHDTPLWVLPSQLPR